MYKISNFSDNDDVKIIDKSGPFEVIEYQRDLSVMPEDAQLAFFCSQMNVRKRQLKCELSRGNVTIQSGAMQWMAGDVSATTGIQRSRRFLIQDDPRKSNWRICDQARIYRRWNSCFRTYI